MLREGETYSRSPSVEFDESHQSIVLDPELAKIAQQVKARQASEAPDESRGVTPAPETSGPEKVSIKVKWKPHPSNPNGVAKTIGFRVNRVSLLAS